MKRQDEIEGIEFTSDLRGITPDSLAGFFVGWKNPPSAAVHLEILMGSDHVVLAVSESAKRVVGFINAVSDGVLSAYIPLLEVLPGYQQRGIGSELVRRVLAKLDHLYMIDLMCDPGLREFYEQQGLQEAFGMVRRNYLRQSGG